MKKKGGKGIRIYHVELGVTRKSATQKAVRCVLCMSGFLC